MMRSELRQLNEEALVVLATVGSIPAFDTLVERFRGAVTLAAEQVLGSRSLAEEIAQEAFLVAFRALPSLEQPAAFPGWLRAITRNLAIKALHKERRCGTTDDLEALVVQSSQALSQRDWLGSIEQEVIYQAIRQLPEDQQEVLYLAAYEDWSISQIAQYLAVPEATVRGRLYRARQAVRQTYYLQEKDNNDR